MPEDAPPPMHPDEVATDAALVARLVATQFLAWAGLPVRRVPSAGTDHAIYRLGDTLAVRLPRRPSAVAQVEKEHRWLPRLAPHLPLAVPAPLAVGTPAEGYPFPWAVVRWLPGVAPAIEAVERDIEAAAALAGFVAALRRVDAAGAPPPGAHNFGRGVPLAARDAATRAAIEALGDRVDRRAVTEAWEVALAAPAHAGPPAWIHGDLMAGNLLVEAGRLTAVIDFGGLCAGDPACDLLPAWMLFAGPARDAFRAALAVDDAAWARGRGWALSVALIQLPYYWDTNPALAASARRAIAEVVGEG